MLDACHGASGGESSQHARHGLACAIVRHRAERASVRHPTPPNHRKKPIWRETDGLFNVVVERRKDGRYRVRRWRKGGDRVEATYPDKDQAIVAAESIWDAYLDGAFDNLEPGPETLDELKEAFYERVRTPRPDERPLSLATREVYLRQLKLFIAFVGGETSLRRVHRKMVESWLAEMTSKPVSKRTSLRTLSALFGWAVHRRWMARNPARGIRIYVQQEVRPWLDWPDWPAFLGACSPMHRIRAGFVLETGLRSGELRHARWSWLHEVNGRIAIRIGPDPYSGFKPKSGRPRAVPLTAQAVQWLKQAKAMWPEGEYIFSDYLQRQGYHLAKANRKACEKASLGRVDFHGLRRSAGARWLANGFALHEVSRLLGHRDISTTMRWYGGVATRHLADRIATLDGPQPGSALQALLSGEASVASVGAVASTATVAETLSELTAVAVGSDLAPPSAAATDSASTFASETAGGAPEHERREQDRQDPDGPGREGPASDPAAQAGREAPEASAAGVAAATKSAAVIDLAAWRKKRS